MTVDKRLEAIEKEVAELRILLPGSRNRKIRKLKADLKALEADVSKAGQAKRSPLKRSNQHS